MALTKKDEVDLSHDCLDQANCTSSAIYEMNQASLKAVLGPGMLLLFLLFSFLFIYYFSILLKDNF